MNLGLVHRENPAHNPNVCREDCCWQEATPEDFRDLTHDMAAAQDEALRDAIHFDNELLADYRYGGSE